LAQKSLTPPKGRPLPPIPPLLVELAAAPLTEDVLETGETEVTRPGCSRETVLVIVTPAWELELDEVAEVDVEVLVEVDVDSTVDVDVEEGVVEVEVKVDDGATLLEGGAELVDDSSSSVEDDGVGEGEAVVGAAEDVVGTTALEEARMSAYLATLGQVTYLG
jgi:hypothetical protein